MINGEECVAMFEGLIVDEVRSHSIAGNFFQVTTPARCGPAGGLPDRRSDVGVRDARSCPPRRKVRAIA
jgi:hypothetical protein